MDERTRHQAAVDALLDQLIDMTAERDKLQEENAYLCLELTECQESL